MHATFPLLAKTDFPAIRRRSLDTLQVNLGYLCNQTCQHCHVNAGPTRTEMMDEQTVGLVLDVLEKNRLATLDLTGGAPEMNPHFRMLVRDARALGVRVIDRCNLTILFEPGHEDLAEFLAAQQVEVTASMPCYSQENVDRQRGEGVFDKSIAGLQKLNALGYGQPGGDLKLSLVYNPQGPSLPPPQPALQADYQRELAKHFGIVFSQLYVLVNMPIQRFGSMLISKGTFTGYLQLLKDNIRLAEQGDGDLGARMHRALAAGLLEHHGAIVIGTDCPGLGVDQLRRAAISDRRCRRHRPTHQSPRRRGSCRCGP